MNLFSSSAHRGNEPGGCVAELGELQVLEAWRNLGLGSALLREVLKQTEPLCKGRLTL